MRKPTRREFGSLMVALVVLGGAGALRDFDEAVTQDSDRNFHDHHVGLNEPVNLNGHTVTVLGYDAARTLTREGSSRERNVTAGMWLVFRVRGDNWSHTLNTDGGGLRYADGTFAERLVMGPGLTQPYGVRLTASMVVEVNPDKLEGAVFEIYNRSYIYSYRPRAVVDPGFDKAAVERIKATDPDRVIVIPSHAEARLEGL